MKGINNIHHPATYLLTAPRLLALRFYTLGCIDLLIKCPRDDPGGRGMWRVAWKVFLKLMRIIREHAA